MDANQTERNVGFDASKQPIGYRAVGSGSSRSAMAALVFMVLAVLLDFRILYFWVLREYDRWELLFGIPYIVSLLLAIGLLTFTRAKRQHDRRLRQVALGLLALELIILVWKQL